MIFYFMCEELYVDESSYVLMTDNTTSTAEQKNEHWIRLIYLGGERVAF